MNLKEKKMKIKKLKAFYMDDWELTEEQKDQLDALATDILNVGIEQGKAEESQNREGYKLVPVNPTDDMIARGNDMQDYGWIDVGDIYKAMIGAVNNDH